MFYVINNFARTFKHVASVLRRILAAVRKGLALNLL